MAHRLGMASGAVAVTPTRCGLTLKVFCESGDHIAAFDCDPGLHPDHVARRMLAKGWTFGSKLACPEHTKKRKAPAAKPAPTAQTAQPTGGTMTKTAAANDAAPTTDAERSSAARKALRMAIQFLEDYFDDSRSNYKPDWSDARIAKETGTSVAAVKEERERLFGPLGEPSELAEIRAELARVEREYKEAMAEAEARFKKAVQPLHVRLAAIAKVNNWPMPLVIA